MSKRPIDMRKEYDFTNMKGRRNPYVKVLKKQVTLRPKRRTKAVVVRLRVRYGG